MDTSTLSKDVMRKYARILQMDNNIPKTKVKVVSVNGSPISSTQTSFIEKLVMSKQSQIADASTILMPRRKHSHSQSMAIKPTTSSPDTHNQFRLDSSINATLQKILTTNFENPGMDSIEERRRSKSIKSKFLAPNNLLEGINVPRFNKLSTRDVIDDTQIISFSKARSKSTFGPFEEDSEFSLDALCREAKAYSEELRTMINQEHESTIKTLTKALNVRDFVGIQRSKLNNVIRIVEKGFPDTRSKDTKTRQEIARLIGAEMNRVRSQYEDFLFSFENAFDKLTYTHGKSNAMKPWDALRLIVESSSELRKIKSQEDEKSEGTMTKKIFEFKLDYKTSKGFNPKILEIFELIEGHVKELNNLISLERQKCQSMAQQQEKLLAEHTELEKKQILLKTELATAMQEVKRGGANNLRKLLFGLEPEEVKLQKANEELKLENAKQSEEMVQLKKELKEMKQELRKLTYKEEKGGKAVAATMDKGVMVNLYNNTTQTIKPVLSLSAYAVDPELCINANKLPKELIVAIMNLMFTDKMITDLCDDYERRPRKALNVYVSEWFLKRFGLYDFCKVIMPDFLLSVQSSTGGDRYRTFRELLGTEKTHFEGYFKFSFDRHTNLNRTKLRTISFSTAESLRQFYRIMNHLKTELKETPSSVLQKHNYGPYMPEPEWNKSMINVEIARKVMEDIVREDNFSIEEVRDTEDYFHFLVQQHQDMLARGNLENSDDTGYFTVGFDMFLRFLLEAIMEKKLRDMEKYYTSLKAHILSQKQGNITYDEFVQAVSKLNPSASQAWKDHAFAYMMNDHAANQVAFSVLMEDFLKGFLNIDAACDFKERGIDDDRDKIFIVGSLDSTPESPTIKRAKGKKPTLARLGTQPVKTQTQISAPTKKIHSETKEKLNLGPSMLNEVGYDFYDTVSSLAVLQESYGLIEESIRAIEKENENLMNIHEEFKRDMKLLPERMIKAQKYDGLTVFNKEDLVSFLEGLWVKFRALLTIIFRGK